MGNAVIRILGALLMLLSTAFAVSVSVSSPANSSTVASPVVIRANASSSYAITGWKIYVDSVDAYTGPASASISASVNMAAGTHQVVVRAWDSTGAFGSSYLNLTVASVAPNTVTVTVNSPANGATVSSPATVSAQAASGNPITGWHIYVDGKDAYVGPTVANIAASLDLSPGTHNLVVRAWNSIGAYGSANLTLNAGGTSEPFPPSNATAFKNLQQSNNYTKCSSLACSGGAAPAWNYWYAPNQTNPSLSGSSTEFHIDGPAYSNALFWLHQARNDTFTNFIFEFDVYLGSNSWNAIQALEYDLYQVAGGYKFMFGTECVYWTKNWEVWNEASGRWVPTNATCNKFTTNTWHHVKWYVRRESKQLHFISVTVDGVTQAISSPYNYQPAAPTNWYEGTFGWQVQLDLGINPGSGYNEWIDRATIYAW